MSFRYVSVNVWGHWHFPNVFPWGPLSLSDSCLISHFFCLHLFPVCCCRKLALHYDSKFIFSFPVPLSGYQGEKKNRRLNIKGCSCCSVTVDSICSIERELSPFSLCFLYWFTNITHQVAYLPLLYPFSSNWRRYI